ADAREGELTVSAYRGDATVLLAWDMAENRRAGLHGFSVARVEPGGSRQWLTNRMTYAGVAETGQSSREAPFQTFRWIDLLRPNAQGTYRYEIQARRSTSSETTVSVAIDVTSGGPVELGFTRPFVAPLAPRGSRAEPL